ncbi:non-ribosomal peptide synthetase [Streptomyces reniochalinae]|uniref:Amino acid adenylation domain-containing protein n=1 Tax=Streptomyces reniochalinae TaxID=2250578 RepID=A0A367EE14_9ACTN|nr:non-ribosomal peptide synthetase [Streptomyces reniochalinae]RCG15962.1 amino acid adenylation domain-containing protein [Streptomyces reniochalinae]WOZ30694.1 BpdD [Streptomyces reniochalinae]
MTGQVVILPDSFERQAARTPDAVALIDGEEVTYAQLDARANRLARLLAGQGLGAGDVCAVLLGRSVELVVSVLAVLKTGAAYVPVDPEDPSDRVEWVLADSAARAVLLSATAGPVPVPSGDGAEPPVWRWHTPQFDEALAAHGDGPLRDEERVRPCGPGDAAYVIYTSGSSGRPKGVVVEHRALSAYLTYARDSYPSVGGLSLLHSSVSFDMAVTTLYAPLTAGGTVRITDLTDARPGDGVPSPAFLKVTPSHLALLRDAAPHCSPSGQLVVGGEMLTGTALDNWRRANPGTRVVNEYGPTEAAVGCCVFTVEPGDGVEPGAVPIGRPTPQTTLYVLDAELNRVEPGLTGELYIAGEQLARGYLNQPALTAAKFVADPHGAPGGRMYRTGDLVRQRPDGELEFLGRMDDQVKVRGYRVELGEVEAAVAGHPAVRHAAVTVREDPGQGARLVAYAVPETGESPEPEEILKHTGSRLPDYMVPSAVVLMRALPLTTNGKLDTKRLPAPDFAARTVYAAPRSTAEQTLCDLVGELTGVVRVGLDDDFFALGGDSLLAARLASRARKEGMDFSLRDILHKRTVRTLTGDAT